MMICVLMLKLLRTLHPKKELALSDNNLSDNIRMKRAVNPFQMLLKGMILNIQYIRAQVMRLVLSKYVFKAF